MRHPVEPDVAERPSHLSLVDTTSVDLERRFRTLTGREPTALELEVFTRWKVARLLGLPVKSRRAGRRLISRRL